MNYNNNSHRQQGRWRGNDYERTRLRSTAAGGSDDFIPVESRESIRESAEVDIWPESPKCLPSPPSSPDLSKQQRQQQQQQQQQQQLKSSNALDSESSDSDNSEDGRSHRRRDDTDGNSEHRRRARRDERSPRSRSASRSPVRTTASASSPLSTTTTTSMAASRSSKMASKPTLVSAGERIPLRGEIGRTGDEIAALEAAGYVMSGSRHAKMNAVRMRKVNQVLNAEERRLEMRRALEERLTAEQQIAAQFREFVEDKVQELGGGIEQLVAQKTMQQSHHQQQHHHHHHDQSHRKP